MLDSDLAQLSVNCLALLTSPFIAHNVRPLSLRFPWVAGPSHTFLHYPNCIFHVYPSVLETMAKQKSVGWRLSSWAAGLALGLLLWLSRADRAIAAPTAPETLHLLNRLGFGPTPGAIAQLEQIGIERYIKQQLNPGAIPEPQALTQRLDSYKTSKLSQTQLSQTFRPSLAKPPGQPPKTNPAFARTVLREAQEARLLRAIASPRQLQEVMVDFWFNHFNVHSGKGNTQLWVGSYEQTAIRPHALGRFRDLLGATARHPAMLLYLDNWRNTAPNSPGARGQFQGLNENYARELMELHTLGVDGGYGQADVESLARILTGWSVQLNADPSQRQESFQFFAQRHDFGNKRFLGQNIPGSGAQEVEQALDILAAHPATARQISYELAQYFVADQPPSSLVDRLAQTFQSTQGDLSQMLDQLFHSEEFWQPQYRNSKFKTPYQYIISSIRLLDSDPPQNLKLPQMTLQRLGMPIYGCPTPDGYGNRKVDWLNPDGLARRLDFATVLARQPGLKAQAEALGQSLEKALGEGSRSWTSNGLGDRLSPETQAAIAAAPAALHPSLILGSPELMWR